jgi:hypothetical protein
LSSEKLPDIQFQFNKFEKRGEIMLSLRGNSNLAKVPKADVPFVERQMWMESLIKRLAAVWQNCAVKLASHRQERGGTLNGTDSPAAASGLI